MNQHIPLEDLSARIDDELAPARRDQVDAHLAACPDCREQLESLRWSVAFTQALPKTPLPPGATLRVPVDESAPPVWRRMLDGGVLVWTGAAAVAIVALGIAALGVWGRGSISSDLATQDGPVAMVLEAPAEPRGDAAAEQSEGNVLVPAGDEAALADSADSPAEGAADGAGVPASVGTADMDVGHPEPLASARAADERDRGFFPPAEIGIDQPKPDITALALAARSRRAEAGTEASAVGARLDDAAVGAASEDEALEAGGRPPGSAERAGSDAPALEADETSADESGDSAAADSAAADSDAAEAEEGDWRSAVVTTRTSDDEAANAEGQELAAAEPLMPPPEIGGAPPDRSLAEEPVPAEGEALAKDSVRESGAQTAATGSRTLPIVPVAALAVVLLALSGLLYVRARR